ncbi:protein Jade-1 [Senna tora]|uniref:Protein Jade-1 n=1 Tax=Senna tora TaxID=362788 RepID=A0A834X1B2_9FABA|nr:protein Jade-1 [Senna tora]
MDSQFHGLPPLKRLRLIQQQRELQDQQQQEEEYECSVVSCSSTLPAKKRKESRDSTFSSNAYSLPAKKRVWALQPDFASDLALSPIDLNVEYKPSFEEQKTEDRDEIIPILSENPQIEIKNDNDDDDDDGIICDVCQSTDGDPSDPIVFCDGCDLMVHASCYGNPLVKGIPEGDWFCEKCKASSSSLEENGKGMVSCCLCPVNEGAMKPTRDGRWAHIVCALLVPEVFFRDPEGRDGIDCSKVPKKRWLEKCYICKCSNGCAIVCSEIKCPLAFHVTCGLKEDLSIEYQEGKKNATIVAGFCNTHTQLWKKQQQSGKYKIVAREDKK